jgi:hypothetical protein
MSTVEERLAKIERELEELRKRQATDKGRWNWLVSGDDRFKDDADLKEIFRLGREARTGQLEQENR